jgi:hypothetical protein
MAQQDPDAGVVALFKYLAQKNEDKSIAAGRPIFDDLEICELRYAGSRNTVGVYPAAGFSHWATDPETGSQVKVTYAERFRRQYAQFKNQATQTKSGTPLTHVPFLTEARRAELRALNIYTVEALAAVDGLELKNLGHQGRDFKNKAIEYLEEAKRGAPNSQMAAELEALRARNELLEADVKLMKDRKEEAAADDDFDGMSLDQLREYITANSGQAPKGTPNRKTLMRMARQCAPGSGEQAA